MTGVLLPRPGNTGRLRILLLTLAALFIGSVLLYGQEVTATINGTITDPSGMGIPGATVTATDLERNVKTTTTTNAAGAYSFPRLPVSRYSIRVEAKGFQASVKPEIPLVLNQVARVDMQLQVGNVSQTVEVTSAPPILETQSTNVETLINSRAIVNMPLSTRNYGQLALMAPGAVTTNASSFAGGSGSSAGLNTFYSGRPYINGNREQDDNYILDGLDNNQSDEGGVAYAPSPDAIQEFNLITANASAEFGNYLGGIINATLKSGTNQFHGDVFEFFRNDKLNANLWQNNWNHLARPLLRYNEFGGTIGGPVVKNKLFFFADYQGERYDQPGTASAFTVFTAQERPGGGPNGGANFGDLCTHAGGAFSSSGMCSSPAGQLYDPYSSSNPATRSIFPFNVIPANRIDPVAAKMLSSSLYPAPSNGNFTNNQINFSHSYTDGDQGDIKVDWAATERDHVYGRYTQQYVTNPTTNSQPLLFNSSNIFPVYSGVLDFTHTFSPTFVNDLRGGVNYFPVSPYASVSNATGQNLSQLYGIPGVPSTFLPLMNLINSLVSNVGTTDIEQDFNDAVIQAEDTAIIVKGQHTMHAGFQFFRYRNDIYYSGQGGAAGEIYFNGQYTALANAAATGNGGADFVLGLPEFISIGQNVGTRGLRYSAIGAFFQDDWKVSSNLTLNLGLRYQLHTPQYEVHNRATNYGLVSGQVYLASNGGSCPYSNCQALYNQYNGITNYQPRIGLAWTPLGSKTVFRAAWGLTDFFEGIGVANIPAANPPWQGAGQASYLSTDPLPGSTLSQGFATLPPPVCTPTAALSTPSPASCFQSQTIHILNPNFRPTVSQQWNVTVQHQFGTATTFSVAYVGEKNTHLTNIYYGHQRVLNPDGTVSNSLFLVGNPALHQETGGVVGFNSGIERIIDSNGYGNYNALEASLARRLSTGLQFQLNYTFSKCLTNAPGFFGQYGDANSGQTQANGGYAFPEYTYNQALDYGPCPNDVSHEFNGYVTYDLPFGHGRTFGKKTSGPVDAVLGGWEVNLLLNVHSGFPFEVTAADNSGTRSGNPRADCIAPPHVFGEKDSPLGGYQFWDPASFAQPTVGHLGSCGTGVIRGPGMTEADLGLSKVFRITESKSLEVRGEAINVANTVILNAPTGRIGASFGLVQSAQLPRNVQLALKFNF